MSGLALVAAGSGFAILAVWAGYPAVMALLARLVRRAPEPALAPPLPHVSVILATRDDPSVVGDRVENLLQAEYPDGKLEVVIARDAAAPEVAFDHPVGADPRVIRVAGDGPGGKASALNAAVRASRGSVLVFADSHQRFDPRTVRALVDALGARTVGAASGRLELPRHGGAGALLATYWRFERALRRHEAMVHSSIGVTGAVWALRRELWEPLPPGLLLDDVYTPMRIVLRGWRVTYVDGAIATETRTASAGSEYRRKVRTLTGVFQVCALLPDVLRPAKNPVWGAFLFHKLLRLATPYLVAAIAVWATVLLARWIIRNPTDAVLGASLCALLLLVTGRRPRRAVAAAAWSALALQAAVVAATINGMRGRWDVWRR